MAGTCVALSYIALHCIPTEMHCNSTSSSMNDGISRGNQWIIYNGWTGTFYKGYANRKCLFGKSRRGAEFVCGTGRQVQCIMECVCARARGDLYVCPPNTALENVIVLVLIGRGARLCPTNSLRLLSGSLSVGMGDGKTKSRRRRLGDDDACFDIKTEIEFWGLVNAKMHSLNWWG